MITERQRDVLRLVACGMPNRVVAEQLGVSQATVRTHMEHVFDRLDVLNRVQAVTVPLRHGLLDIHELEVAPGEGPIRLSSGPSNVMTQ